MPPDEKLPYAATKPAMPAQPQTVSVPAMTDRAMLEDLYRLAKQTTAVNDAQTAQLDKLAANDAVIIHSVDILAGRVTLLERRVDEVEARGDQASIRAKQPSEHDLQTKAELAKEVVAREALAAEVATIKTETLAQSKALTAIAIDASKAVSGFVHEHPILFRSLATIATTIATAAAAWLSAKGH